MQKSACVLVANRGRLLRVRRLTMFDMVDLGAPGCWVSRLNQGGMRASKVGAWHSLTDCYCTRTRYATPTQTRSYVLDSVRTIPRLLYYYAVALDLTLIGTILTAKLHSMAGEPYKAFC